MEFINEFMPVRKEETPEVAVLRHQMEARQRELIGLKQRLHEVSKAGESAEETLDRIIRLASVNASRKG